VWRPARPESAPRTVAVLPWGNVIEDYLGVLNMSMEDMAERMSGGWLFGYVEALRRVGVRGVVFCVSTAVREVTRLTHAPTGSTLCLLPVPGAYAALRRTLADPYAWTVEDLVGRESPGRSTRFRARLVRDVAFYLATPLRALARELRREECDAILCQEYEYARFDALVLVGRLLGIPVFATFQGGDWQLSRAERFVRPLSVRAAAGLIIGTRTEAARVARRYPAVAGRIARIFNPIDLSQWSPVDRGAARVALGIPAGARVAVWHGRVDIRRKGIDVLLDAWERVAQSRPAADLRLLLVGTGVDAAALRGRLSARPVPGVVWRDEYLLDREAMRGYLSAADVYAFPSRHEGFPVAPLEAMACGLPVVAANAPGVPDILEDGEAHGGIVVPREDAAAFATALGALLDEPDRARVMGELARARTASAFALEAVGGQLHEFLLSGI
jgi:glycosyltransferase involved in cell wall biosynthesis